MRLLYVFLVEESGPNIQDREQDNREVVCNKGVGRPLTFKEDAPAAKNAHNQTGDHRIPGSVRLELGVEW